MDAELEKILEKLNPKVRKNARIGDELKLERQETGSIGLNRALEGGIGYGRQTLFWGNKSSGKSSLALATIAKAQQRGKTAAWLDVENSYDQSWAERLGVDPDKILVHKVYTISDMIETAGELIDAGTDIVVVDSISPLMPSAWFSDKGELKTVDDTKQIGTVSVELGKGTAMLNSLNKKTALIYISQVRNKLSTHGAYGQPTGGHSTMFMSSTIIKLSSSARLPEQIMKEMTVGNRIEKVPVGRKVIWSVDYNKIGPPGLIGDYNFYYKGDIGIDTVGEILTIGVQSGIIKKGGAWYTFGDEKFQGEIAAADYLRSNPELLSEIERKIYELE